MERLESSLGLTPPRPSLIVPRIASSPRALPPPPNLPPTLALTDPWITQDPWTRAADQGQPLGADLSRWAAQAEDRWTNWQPQFWLPPNMANIPVDPQTTAPPQAPRRGVEIGPQGQRRTRQRVQDDDEFQAPIPKTDSERGRPRPHPDRRGDRRSSAEQQSPPSCANPWSHPGFQAQLQPLWVFKH